MAGETGDGVFADERRPAVEVEPRPTLGQRLDSLARGRMASLAPRLAWAGPFAALARRVEQLGDAGGERFERVEQFLPQRVPAPAARRVPTERTEPGAGWSGSAAGTAIAPDVKATARPGPAPAAGEGAGSAGPDTEVREVPTSVRSRLRRLVGPAADVMRVHAGPRAEATTHAADADAVTAGRDVYIRPDRFAPQREEGVALLAHEATHVAALLDPGRTWRRAVGDQAEEMLARDRERRVITSGPVVAPWPPAGTANVLDGARPTTMARSQPPVGAAAAPNPGAQVARAATDRDLGEAQAPAPDLDALRRDVVAEVMRQITSEYERGG